MSNERPPTARALNAMTDPEKIEFARSPFVKQLQLTAGTYVTTFRRGYVHAILGTQRWRNGSEFFTTLAAVSSPSPRRMSITSILRANGQTDGAWEDCMPTRQPHV